MDGKILHFWVTGLSADGVVFTVLGDNLKVDAPAGVLTPDLVTHLTENKAEILANRMRSSVAREHLGELREQLTRKGVRLDWANESEEVKQAEAAIEESVLDYVAGAEPIDGITRAFWRWVAIAAEHAPAAETRIL